MRSPFQLSIQSLFSFDHCGGFRVGIEPREEKGKERNHVGHNGGIGSRFAFEEKRVESRTRE